MHSANRSRRWVVAILVGGFYAAVGILFAKYAPDVWGRRLAWLISAIGFAGHIAYEQFLCRSGPRLLATRVAAAAAIGAFGLAVAANVHSWSAPAANHRGLVIASVAWPILVGIPAFIVALVAAAIAKRAWGRRSK
jgi:hypothetical protein